MAFVGVCFRNGSIQCSAFALQKDTPYIYAYADYALSIPSQLTIFNYTEIHTILDLFLTTYNVKDPIYIFALDGPGIEESLQNSLADKKGDYDGYCWQEQTITSSLHYRVGIKHELLLQYQLLAYQRNLQLVSLTTPLMAHLYAHTLYLSQLPFPHTISITELKQFLQSTTNHYLSLLPFATTNTQPSYVIEALGLYHIAKKSYETN